MWALKKLLIIILLCLFGYLQIGYLVHMAALRTSARREARQTFLTSIPDSSLVKFSAIHLSSKAIWEEPDKEFWLDGELYDVVRIDADNKSTTYYCIADAKEKKVVEKESELTAKNHTSAGKSAKNLNYSFPEFTNVSNQLLVTSPISLNKCFIELKSKEILQFYSPDSPPPQA